MAVGFAPSRVFAEWTDFVPTPVENEAFLEVFTSFERDNHRGGSRSVRWTDTFIREKLTLYSIGYSYHPRFLQYQFSVAGIGKQEDYDSTAIESRGWRYGSGLEYYARLLLLPEHHYNLDAYVSRYEPKYKEQAATEHDSVATSHGASVRYRKKPYFLYAGYGQDSIDSEEASSDVTRFRLTGEYFKRYANGNELSFNGAFNPSWFSNSQDIEGNSTEYVLGNFLHLWRVRLNSSLTKSLFDQESRSLEKFKTDQLAWYELLTAYLPWNFRTDLSYRFQDNEAKIDQAGATPTRTLSDRSKNLQVNVLHHLYQSLDSAYTFLHNSRNSRGGESTTMFHGLNFNYTKLIPLGRFLAGVSLGRGETDNSGQASVVNEPFSAIPVPGSFILPQQNVEPGSITVFLKSPLPPFEAILLEENVHYVVIAVLNTFEIQLLTLPPQFAVPGTYDFLVSYSLASGDFGLQTDTFGGNTSVELFENLLTPYFSYVTIRSEVVSGVFPGVPVDSTTYTAGLIVHLGSLRVRGEYQNVDWDVTPYESWRAEVQYMGDLTLSTNVYATASYLNKHFSQGTSEFQAVAFTEKTTSASGGIRQQLFSRNMYLSAGGSYSRLEGLVDGNTYSLNASWVWTLGKLDVTVGASAFAAETKGPTIISTERDHQFFYLNLRRRLF